MWPPFLWMWRDVKHVIFQHYLPGWLRKYFGLPSFTAAELCIVELSCVAVAPETRIFPCMAVVPMGWTWAVHFVQLIHEGVLQEAVGDDVVIAKDVVASPGLEGNCIAFLYVDNIIVQGTSAEEVDGVLGSYCVVC